MSLSDGAFRASILGGGSLLVLGIAAVRFCGSVSLPPRPASRPAQVTGTAEDLLSASETSPAMYLDLLARDAAAAGLVPPMLEEMSRRLAHRMDEDVTCSKWASARSRSPASS